MVSNLPLTDIFVYVIHEGMAGVEHALNVLGGYYAGGNMLVLFREAADAFQPSSDGIAKLVEAQGGILMGEHNDIEYLTDEDWTTFSLLEPGSQFRMGGGVWTKLSIEELRQLLHNKSLIAV